VNVESTPGRGSRFTVSLPALTASPVSGESRERASAVH
jgi:signal transduction histidine kinase